MVKKLIIFILVLSSIVISAKAQKKPVDSISKLATADVKRLFKLKNPELHNFRKYRYTSSSDYFKPSALNVSNPVLTKDSSYVNAYRTAAYYKTKKRRTTGHYILIGGVSFVGATTIVGLALLGAHTK